MRNRDPTPPAAAAVSAAVAQCRHHNNRGSKHYPKHRGCPNGEEQPQEAQRDRGGCTTRVHGQCQAGRRQEDEGHRCSAVVAGDIGW